MPERIEQRLNEKKPRARVNGNMKKAETCLLTDGTSNDAGGRTNRGRAARLQLAVQIARLHFLEAVTLQLRDNAVLAHRVQTMKHTRLKQQHFFIFINYSSSLSK